LFAVRPKLHDLSVGPQSARLLQHKENPMKNRTKLIGTALLFFALVAQTAQAGNKKTPPPPAPPSGWNIVVNAPYFLLSIFGL
jgi:hypothetical protein